jgi:hypothetical protein
MSEIQQEMLENLQEASRTVKKHQYPCGSKKGPMIHHDSSDKLSQDFSAPYNHATLEQGFPHWWWRRVSKPITKTVRISSLAVAARRGARRARSECRPPRRRGLSRPLASFPSAAVVNPWSIGVRGQPWRPWSTRGQLASVVNQRSFGVRGQPWRPWSTRGQLASVVNPGVHGQPAVNWRPWSTLASVVNQRSIGVRARPPSPEAPADPRGLTTQTPHATSRVKAGHRHGRQHGRGLRNGCSSEVK